MGLPTINTVFNHTDATKEAYNRAEPRNDVANYSDDVSGVVELITSLAGTASDPAAYGDAIAGVLLPDVITYDTSSPRTSRALNGRALTDDVIDVALSVVANTPLTDCVADDSVFRTYFPYVGLAELTGPDGPMPPPADRRRWSVRRWTTNHDTTIRPTDHTPGSDSAVCIGARPGRLRRVRPQSPAHWPGATGTSARARRRR